MLHAWRNSLLPVATLVGGAFATLVEGSFVVETVFRWPGMSRLGVDAILHRDYPVVCGVALLSSVFVLSGNFLSDAAIVLLDPRLRK